MECLVFLQSRGQASLPGYYRLSSRSGIHLYRLDDASRLQTGMSRWDYLATQFRVLVTYLRILLLPIGQHVDYDYPVSRSFLEPRVLLSAVVLCSLFGCAIYCLYLARQRGRTDGKNTDAALLTMIAFGIFWFFITHAIESSLIPIVDVIFEHRMYLPSAGIFMAVAAAVSLAGEAGDRDPRLATSAGLDGRGRGDSGPGRGYRCQEPGMAQ